MGTKTHFSTSKSLCGLLMREAVRYRTFAEQASGKLGEDTDAIARIAEFFAGCLTKGNGSIGNSVYIPVTKQDLAKILLIHVDEVEGRVRDVSIATRHNYKLIDLATNYSF